VNRTAIIFLACCLTASPVMAGAGAGASGPSGQTPEKNESENSRLASKIARHDIERYGWFEALVQHARRARIRADEIERGYGANCGACSREPNGDYENGH